MIIINLCGQVDGKLGLGSGAVTITIPQNITPLKQRISSTLLEELCQVESNCGRNVLVEEQLQPFLSC